MEVLKVFFKVVLFLIGALFLVSGLFCGAMSIGSGSGWILGLIGLALAALGGFLVALPFGLVGKKNLPEQPVISEEIGEGSMPANDEERRQP